MFHAQNREPSAGVGSPIRKVALLFALIGTCDGFSLGLRTVSVQPASKLSRAVCSPRPVHARASGVSSLKSQWADEGGSGPPMDKEPLEVSEENVILALQETKDTLQTMFGNFEENRKIGITGDVSMVDVDGPFVTVRLEGRFWHKRVDVLARVENYLKTRIPEIVEVSIEDPAQLDDNNPDNQ